MKRIIGLHIVLALFAALAPATVAHAQEGGGGLGTQCLAAVAVLENYYNNRGGVTQAQAYQAMDNCAAELPTPPEPPDLPPGDPNVGVDLTDNPCGLGQEWDNANNRCFTPGLVWHAAPDKCTRIQTGVITETGADGTQTQRTVYRDNPNWIADRAARNVPSGRVPWDCQPRHRCELYDRMAGFEPPATNSQRANGVRVAWSVNEQRQQTHATLYHPCHIGGPAQPASGQPDVMPGTISTTP